MTEARPGPGGLGRSVRSMALGTTASRITGFLRTAVIASAIGVEGLGLAYDVANTAPNIIFDLLLGGVLSAVIVPVLVRAVHEDADGGDAYTARLLTLVVLGLGATSVLLVLTAPLVVDLYLGEGVPAAERSLAIVFARFFLPQVLFYGAGAVMGAALNSRGRFGAPMWAPVLNNVVVIVTGLLFLLLPGGTGVRTEGASAVGVLVLGVGTTLGVVVQTIALVPSLRRVGVPLRPRFDLRAVGLGRIARLAKWVFLYVLANQVAFLVVVRLGSDAFEATPDRSYSSFVKAYVLWQLPHAVVAVSVITGLLPRMSRAAADGRLTDLRASMDGGLRLTAVVLVPAVAAFLVLGPDIAAVVFARGNIEVGQARYIGLLLQVLALGLLPFSTYQLQLRAFYAQQDTRTPFRINLAVNGSMVLGDLVLFALLPPRLKVVGLAAGQSLSFAVGLAVCTLVLSRRLGEPVGADLARTTGRALLAVAGPAALAGLLAVAAHRVLGDGPRGSLAALVAGGGVLVVGYLLMARWLRLTELDEVVDPVLRRVGRR